MTMRILQKFLFLFKSKYRRKWRTRTFQTSFLLPYFFSKLLMFEGAKDLLSRNVTGSIISRSIYLLEVLGFGLSVFAFMTFPAVGGTEVTSSVNHNINVSPLKNLNPNQHQTSNCEPSSVLNDTSTPTFARCHGHGECLSNACVCHDGWTGAYCEYCYGKVRLNGERGWITDGLGNYTSNMKCTWLIESTQKLSNGSTVTKPIFLNIEEFATECGWDHLYIFDGDSVHSPLLSVFSGLLVENNYRVHKKPEVVAKSGFALLHFYTDVAYNLTGFNITYRTHACPTEDSSRVCSGNGACVDGRCTCDARWTGEACNLEKCPNNCSGHGDCDMESQVTKCRCNAGYKGHDCSQREDSEFGFWEVLSPKSPFPKGVASHTATVHNNSLWIIGGTSLNLDMKKSPIYRYDFRQNSLEKVQGKGVGNFPGLYGHSSVLFDNKIYVYGGVHDGKFGTRYVSNAVWSFDLITRYWSEVSVTRDSSGCKRSMCGPIQLAGHTAVVVHDKGNKTRHGKSKMVVLLGHSPYYGYTNVVQEFHFARNVWNIVKTKGYPVGGSFGHTSSWDPTTQRIYVYGGYRIGDIALSTTLHSYDPVMRTWDLLESGPEGRFLHASQILNGFLMIFGGNGHNDTAYSLGSKCFTSEVMVYDIGCNSWSTLNPPANLPTDLSRYGHSAVLYESSIYLWGGFNGFVLQDLIRFTPPTCGSLSVYNCESSLGVLARKCEWDSISYLCRNIVSNKDKSLCLNSSTPEENGPEHCKNFTSCSACVQNKYDCVWCGSHCQYSDLRCRDSKYKAVVTLEQCGSEETVCSPFLHNCLLCSSELNCVWNKDVQCIKEITAFVNGTEKEPVICDRSCSDHTSCFNCTASNCIWCNNLSTCVDKNAYVISFPYGQCMSWAQSPSLCHSKDKMSANTTSQCKDVASCDTCLTLPSCGWCDSGSGTGLGQCLEGSSRGALYLNSSGAVLDKKACSHKHWNFTSCPACQCNGHSSCDERNRCIECEGFTEGNHCESCIPGYHGNAINGGQCKPCECNGQAESCNAETGRCYCTTKGIAGEHCERCDTQINYTGDPTNGGSCFYDLQIDFQFTFNLSKKEDLYYTQINFRNVPTRPDTDADFQITCSSLSKFNISVITGGQPEKVLLSSHNCTTFKTRFQKLDYSFGSSDNTTFYVYVYDLQPPLWIQISFSQNPKLDLLHFFITFSTCFLILLVLAAILWKIKQKYDMYRRRQRLFVEMEQMASRPFAQVYMEVGKVRGTNELSSLRKRRKDCPGPIALEPCHGNRAAVLSCLIAMPSGGQGFVPPGQSGICVGSALIALGNPRKLSFEPISKTTEGKNGKLRKSVPSHSLSTCI